MQLGLGPPSAQPAAAYPTTVTGKRNWSWRAVHGDVPVPSKDTVPAAPGGFADLIDVINPLQHIPIVSNVYRAMTGDTISPAGRILGGTLFGGPFGFMAGVGSTIVSETTGKDVSEHILASLFGGKDSTNSASSALRASAQYDAASRLRF